jgi:Caspase domain
VLGLVAALAAVVNSKRRQGVALQINSTPMRYTLLMLLLVFGGMLVATRERADFASPQEISSRAPFAIVIPELGGNPISTVDLPIPSPAIRTIKLIVKQPFADNIRYGKIYTKINGEAANTIQEIRSSSEGKVIICDLEKQPRFHLAPGKNVVEISAIDNGGQSYYASYVLIAGAAGRNRTPSSSSEPALTKFSGRKFAVVLGVSHFKYKDAGLHDLDYADSDARAVRDFLRSPQGGGFASDDVLYLENEAATSEAVRAALNRFLPKAGPADLVFIYIASHGSNDPFDPQKLYFIVHDTKIADMPNTAFGMSELQDLLDHVVRAQRVVAFIDACHSAGISGKKLVTGRQLAYQENNIFNLYAAKLYTETGHAVLTSSDVDEVSEEGANWGGGHGVFTWELLQGLRGAADLNHDHVITAGELFDYVSNRVREETKSRQNPRALSGLNANLPLATTSN